MITQPSSLAQTYAYIPNSNSTVVKHRIFHVPWLWTNNIMNSSVYCCERLFNAFTSCWKPKPNCQLETVIVEKVFVLSFASVFFSSSSFCEIVASYYNKLKKDIYLCLAHFILCCQRNPSSINKSSNLLVAGHVVQSVTCLTAHLRVTSLIPARVHFVEIDHKIISSHSPPFRLFKKGCCQLQVREHSGSVVECLTQDRRAAGSSLTGVTALCP